ncbi:MAG: hypothetical protein AVDCRST_MAG96-1686, partial [uncultured Segetibacter sp.]
SSSPNDIDYCFSNGANYYVVKPYSFNDFRQVVNDMCTGTKLKHHQMR